MAKIVKIAPPNSLVVICDLADGEVPEFIPDRLVLATDTLILVRCLANMDGETEIRLGPPREVGQDGAPVFDGVLKTPMRELVVSTVEHETLVSDRVPSQTTRVRIWTTSRSNPARSRSAGRLGTIPRVLGTAGRPACVPTEARF